MNPAQRAPCIGRNPLCPCQDGDACHYRDTPTTKGWPVPDFDDDAQDEPVCPHCSGDGISRPAQDAGRNVGGIEVSATTTTDAMPTETQLWQALRVLFGTNMVAASLTVLKMEGGKSYFLTYTHSRRSANDPRTTRGR